MGDEVMMSSTHTRGGRRAIRWLLGMTLGLVTTIVGATTAGATWSLQGSGSGASGALTMPTGATPIVRSVGSTVSLSWTAATFVDGVPVSGYMITRYNTINASVSVVGGTCTGPVSTTSCVDLSVPPGTWFYTDTPVVNSWTGGQSADSSPATVP
jgi:hypothetical protein